jgi:hypothetical protein
MVASAAKLECLLKEPKSKNYQDGKDKEDDRRNPIASGRSVCVHGTIPLKNVRHLANGDSTVRLSHRRNFSVMAATFRSGIASRFAQLLPQLRKVRCDPPRLVLRELLGRCDPDNEAAGISSTDQGGDDC